MPTFANSLHIELISQRSCVNHNSYTTHKIEHLICTNFQPTKNLGGSQQKDAHHELHL